MIKLKIEGALAALYLLCCCTMGEAVPQEPLKVGVILPLSGPVAFMGEAFQRGVTLFAEEHPASYAQLQVTLEDHHYDGKAVVSALNKLIDVDKSNMVIVWGNTPSGAAAPVAEARKIPALLVSMNPDALDRHYVLSFGSKNGPLIEQVLKFYRLNNSAHPAVVTVDLGNILQGIELMRKTLGEKLYVQVVANDEHDFTPMILNLRRNHTDALMLFALQEQAMTFARQAAALGVRLPVVGGDVFADLNYARQMQQYLPLVAFPYGLVKQAFVDKLEKRFGTSAYFYESAAGYSIMQICANAAQSWKHESPESLLNSLQPPSAEEVPIVGLRREYDQEFGAHFTNEVALYYADGSRH